MLVRVARGSRASMRGRRGLALATRFAAGVRSKRLATIGGCAPGASHRLHDAFPPHTRPAAWVVGLGRRRGSIVLVARGGIGQVGQDVVVKEGRTRAGRDVFGRDHHVAVQKGHGQLEVPFEAVVRIGVGSSGRVR